MYRRKLNITEFDRIKFREKCDFMTNLEKLRDEKGLLKKEGVKVIGCS